MQPENVNRRLIKFIYAAIIFFAWVLIQGAIMSPQQIRMFLQEGPAILISAVHTHIGVMGWLSLPLMATIYYLVPNLSGKPIVWPKLIGWIFWIWVFCLTAAGVLMLIAGITGGQSFAEGVRGKELASIVIFYGLPSNILFMITAVAGLMFVVQVLVSLSRDSEGAS